ncbi:hypothetical protein EIP91_002869 [Steccherinum ochraceum]|uniref:MYND-type domain-containing protein n=1 Tax=Steccherinum ochraceum TaxID=92696 RepID=A0A4R0S2D8_9APHY|nr:hypothetical protein EIP91_002869 [Steccherinum ochraceum]
MDRPLYTFANPGPTVPPQRRRDATCSYFNCPLRLDHLTGATPSIPVATLKCARCKSAYYCGQACQKADWSSHKEFCKVWAATSANSGDVSVAQIKIKMVELIQLIRGMPEYTEHLWSTYQRYKPQCARGFMEVSFDNFQQLYDAIDLVKSFPVYDTVTFKGGPGTPSEALAKPGAGGGQKLKLRKLPDNQAQKFRFVQCVEGKMCFSSNDDRRNLQMALNMTMSPLTDMFVISVHVALEGDYNTNVCDMIYKNLSFGA